MPLDERPGLIFLYFDEPDGIARSYGPEHQETGDVVNYLDSVLGYLRSEIAELECGELVNLIVLSDHGMGPISPDKYVNLEEHLKEEWTVSVVGGSQRMAKGGDPRTASLWHQRPFSGYCCGRR